MEPAKASGKKRQRDDNQSVVEKDQCVKSTVETKSHAVTKEANEERKKPRQEARPKTTLNLPQAPPADVSEATEDMDPEALLMRALEEAIERDAANATKVAVPITVDEDDDYDESD